MPRKPRLEFPGAIYHINHRGNHQEYIFLDDYDRKLFLKLLQATIQRMNWICHAYCLIGNHYHLLIEIPEGILSRGMAWLNSVYTQKFNQKYDMSGHLFQGRFKSKPIEDNMQFLMAARYVARNPLQANLVERADQWPWSSYSATVGLIKAPDYLFIDDILSCLATDRQVAQVFYRELVHLEDKANDDEIIKLFQKVYEQEREPVFQKRARTVIDMKNSLGPIPRSQRILSRPDLSELFNGNEERDLEMRNNIINAAFTLYAYTQAELADYLNITRSAISKIVCKTRS
jgi:REP element-mobilizing transposase RayT